MKKVHLDDYDADSLEPENPIESLDCLEQFLGATYLDFKGTLHIPCEEFKAHFDICRKEIEEMMKK